MVGPICGDSGPATAHSRGMDTLKSLRPRRTDDLPPHRVLAWARSPWLWLVLVAVGAALSRAGAVTGSLHYFTEAARLLVTGGPTGGLHLYGAHPELQFGPASTLTALPLLLVPPALRPPLVAAALTGGGLLALRLLYDLVPHRARSHRRLLLAGVPFLLAWSEVAVHAGHLDDVLAVVAGVVALRLLRSHPGLAAVALAVAVDAKPWALGFAAMLLVVDRAHRRRTWLIWLVLVAAAWVPFVLADPHTLASAHFTIPNTSASALQALGVHDARTPGWDRPLQLVLGCVLGAVLARRGRPEAVLFVVMATRMALDPSTYNYYTSTLLLGAVAVDLLLLTGRRAWVTPTAFVALFVVRNAQHLGNGALDHALGLDRLLFLAGVSLLLLTAAWPGSARRVSPAGPPSRGAG